MEPRLLGTQGDRREAHHKQYLWRPARFYLAMFPQTTASPLCQTAQLKWWEEQPADIPGRLCVCVGPVYMLLNIV